MCREAGTGWDKSSPSLHATTATYLFRQGASEKVIEWTRHHTIKVLCYYERLVMCNTRQCHLYFQMPLLTHVPWLMVNNGCPSKINVYMFFCGSTNPIYKASRSTWIMDVLETSTIYHHQLQFRLNQQLFNIQEQLHWFRSWTKSISTLIDTLR